MTNKFNTIVEKIRQAEKRLECSGNNLQYIKNLYSLRLWMERLSNFPDSYEYKKYFLTGFITVYERVNNSILEYRYGNKPF